MLWTPEAVEDLKRLALEGRSASGIAAALGIGSRNAVIGKANRIGIKLNGGARGKPRASRGRAKWAMVRDYEPGADIPSSAVDPTRDPGVKRGAERRAAAWIFGEAEIGEMPRVRFDEIPELACRWPLGDPRTGEFAYCGLMPAKGHSYCAGHCRMAYRPPNAARQSPRHGQANHSLANMWRLF
jgi:GcrA cell cycle regulator